uniref:Uncharacterized protein n=1 Tax=Trichogramma kaykai TaxID=54128 RepID=A0ABD2W5P6_9HYME
MQNFVPYTGCAAKYVSSRNYEIAWRDRSPHMDAASRAVIHSSDSCSRIPVVVVAAAATVVVIMKQLVVVYA